MHVYIDTNMLTQADTKYVHVCFSWASEIIPTTSIQEQQQ